MTIRLADTMEMRKRRMAVCVGMFIPHLLPLLYVDTTAEYFRYEIEQRLFVLNSSIQFRLTALEHPSID